MAEELDEKTIIQPNKPVQFEWRNFRRQYRERTSAGGGRVSLYLIQVEINAEDWATLETMPSNTNGEMMMWFTDGAEPPQEKPEKPKKEKKPKEPTPHGAMWEWLLHRNKGFEHCPGVREALNAASVLVGETPHQLMRKVFGVKSLSREVGPKEIYAMFPPSLYPGVNGMVKRALKQT